MIGSDRRNRVPAASRSLQAAARPAETLADLDAAIADHPADPDLRLRRAVLLRQVDRNADSIAALTELLAGDPDDLRIRLELAVSRRLEGDFPGSERLLDSVLARAPRHRRALLARVDNAVHGQDFAAALQRLEQALVWFPDDLDLKIRRGVLLRQSHRLADSIAALDCLCRQHPAHLQLRLELAGSQRLAGDIAGAEASVDAVLAQAPHSRPALIGKVENAVQAQDFVAALGHLDRGLMRWRGDLGLQIRRGVLLRQSHRLADSIAHLQALNRRHPEHARLKLELAAAYRADGDIAAAEALGEAVLARAPRNRRALIGRLDDAVQAGDATAAMAHLQRALAAFPADPALHMRLGRLLRSLHRDADSIAVLRNLLTRWPEFLPAKVELAESLRQTGAVAEGRALVEAVLAAEPGNLAALVARVAHAAQAPDSAAGLGNLARRLTVAPGGGPPATAADAVVLARILLASGAVADRDSLLRAAPLLCRHADALGAKAMWGLFELAEVQGLDSDYLPLLSRLLDRQRIPAGVAAAMLRRAADLRLDNWQRLADLLARKVGGADREVFSLRRDELMFGAEAALRRRDRRRSLPPSPQEIVARTLLLQQIGQLRLACRYLALARRAHPHHLPLLQSLALHLARSGETDRAATLLAELTVDPAAMSPQKTALAARIAAELGRLDQARALIEAIEAPDVLAPLAAPYLRILLAQGDLDRAVAVAGRSQAGTGPKAMHHFGTTLPGLEIAEMRLSAGEEGGAQFLLPAIRTIDAWRSRRAAPRPRPHPIPARVMQYWNDARPPASIARSMQSWRSREGLDYVLFSRSKALRYLADRLDASWARALQQARNPAEESDFFRLCHLMLEGGIYADCDDWLIGDIGALVAVHSGLVLFREPFAVIGNNVMLSAPGQPAIVYAALQARRALLARDNESTWAKTGPALLTRSVATAIEAAGAGAGSLDMTILDRNALGRWVQFHTPQDYKRSRIHWHAARSSGRSPGLGRVLDERALRAS